MFAVLYPRWLANLLRPCLRFGSPSITSLFMDETQLNDEIDIEKKKYIKNKKEKYNEEHLKDNYPISAFVLFNSFKDRERVKKAFDENLTCYGYINYAKVHQYFES